MPQETLIAIGAVVAVFAFFAVVLAYSDATWDRKNGDGN